jgi:hypothetical protein
MCGAVRCGGVGCVGVEHHSMTSLGEALGQAVEELDEVVG